MGKERDNIASEYRKLMKKAGTYCIQLDPAIRRAAQTEELLNQLYEELATRPLIEMSMNVKGDPVEKESPLLALIVKFDNLHLAQLRALGLNYDANPVKVKDAVMKEDDKDDALIKLLKTRSK